MDRAGEIAREAQTEKEQSATAFSASTGSNRNQPLITNLFVK